MVDVCEEGEILVGRNCEVGRSDDVEIGLQTRI